VACRSCKLFPRKLVALLAVVAALSACAVQDAIDNAQNNYDFKQQKWTPLDVGVQDDLNGIQMIDATKGFIVGDKGVVLKTSDGGATWSKGYPAVMAGQKLVSVSFPSPLLGFVASTTTLFYTTDGGETWGERYKFKEKLREELKSVRMVTAGAGYAVTPVQSFLRGVKTHAYQTLDGGVTFVDTKLVNVNNFEPTGEAVFAAGTNIYRGKLGAGWTGLLAADQTCTVCASWVNFISPTAGWAVIASSGTIDSYTKTFAVLRTNDGGGRWANLPVQNYAGGPLGASLNGVSYDTLRQLRFADAQRGWMAYGGVLLSTTDGGQTWIWQTQSFIGHNGNRETYSKYAMESPRSFGFKDLAVRDATHAWAVGDKGLVCRYVGEDYPAFHED
jgi:photosystem II stability/assembly factor-like uncharacterized protein